MFLGSPRKPVELAPAVTEPPVVTREDVLLRAAELIETHGWARGNKGMRLSGPYCVLGAVAAAMKENQIEVPRLFGRWGTHDMITPASLMRVHWKRVFKWNDHRCHDRYEAAKRLRSMARGARCYW